MGRGPVGGPDMMIRMLDDNDNGTIERDEAFERMQAMFERLDTNSDGSVDTDELERFRQQMPPRDGRFGRPLERSREAGRERGDRRPSDGDEKGNDDKNEVDKGDDK